MTTVEIKPARSAEGHPATNVWITHDGVRYYSRLNYGLDDTSGQRAYMLQLFEQRRKRYAANG